MECSAPDIPQSQFEFEFTEIAANKTYVISTNNILFMCIGMIISFLFKILLKIVENVLILYSVLFSFIPIASPAGSKLGLRMTTLHEEPVRQTRLDEEPEDSYSDPDYADFDNYGDESNQQKSKMGNKSRLTSSQTVDSFIDIGRTSSNLLNYNAITGGNAANLLSASNSNNVNNNSNNSNNSNNAKNILTTVIGTPSMSSSTSSGYGSQAVSCSNLTNDDTLSLRSMSVDDTPDFDKSATSSSPPNKMLATTTTVTSTAFTPNGQKRFNPFMKDMNMDLKQTAHFSPPALSPTMKKPLTPTKEHPLQDLAERNDEHVDDDDDDLDDDEENYNNSDENKNVINKNKSNTAKTNNALNNSNVNNNNNVDEEICDENNYNHSTNIIDDNLENNMDDNQNSNMKTEILKLQNERNNKVVDYDSPNEGSGIVKTSLPPGKVVRRKKQTNSTLTSSTATTGSMKNLHRASLPIIKVGSGIMENKGKLENQVGTLGSETDSSEKLEGKYTSLGIINSFE